MYYEDILRYCIYHAPDKTAAEDAVQETFLKVIRYMPNYRHRGKFRAFLYKVAANTCKDQWRKGAREEWFDTDSEASDGEKKLSEEMIYLETGYAKTEGNINFPKTDPGAFKGAERSSISKICTGTFVS